MARGRGLSVFILWSSIYTVTIVYNMWLHLNRDFKNVTFGLSKSNAKVTFLELAILSVNSTLL